MKPIVYDLTRTDESDLKKIKLQPIKELTTDQENIIKSFNETSNEQLIIRQEKTSNYILNLETIKNLYNTACWASDEVINAYASMINNNYRNEVYVFPSAYIRSLHLKNKNTEEQIINKYWNYDPQFLQTMKMKLLFPVNEVYTGEEYNRLPNIGEKGTHWTLAVIDFGEESFKFYDSFGGKNKDIIPILTNYLTSIGIHKEFKVKHIITKKQQKGGNDCGMFLCKYMHAVAANYDATKFSSNDQENMRKLITWELLTYNLQDFPYESSRKGGYKKRFNSKKKSSKVRTLKVRSSKRKIIKNR